MRGKCRLRTQDTKLSQNHPHWAVTESYFRIYLILVTTRTLGVSIYLEQMVAILHMTSALVAPLVAVG